MNNNSAVPVPSDVLNYFIISTLHVTLFLYIVTNNAIICDKLSTANLYKIQYCQARKIKVQKTV
jgi:hypothetical protein